MRRSVVFPVCLIGVILCFSCIGTYAYKSYKKHSIKSIILLGKPGCGKGTQAKIWAEKYNLYHVDAGQLLRNCVKNNCKYKDEIQKAFREGSMVRNEITAYALKKEFNDNVYCLTCKYRGAIIDGCPRNMQNVKIFEENNFNVVAVLDLNVSDDISKQRVMSRNSGRADDNEQVLNRRLNYFRENTLPVFEYFKAKKMYNKIDANATKDEVLKNSMAVLDRYFSLKQ